MQKTNKPKNERCPICRSQPVLIRGYDKNSYYAKCKNGCCVTNYAPTEAEAKRLWNDNKMFLTQREKDKFSTPRKTGLAV